MSNFFSQFKSMLFLNGDFAVNTEQLPFTVAADGAAWRMHTLGLSPDLIIGDLDSLKSRSDWKAVFNNSEIIEDSDQEKNDFEKALNLLRQKKLTPCLIAGMQGGDLEHSLNNWSILIKYCSEMNLAVIENDRLAIPLHPGHKTTINCPAGSIVSLIPQPECRLSTQGLKWELNNEVLRLGNREGARNRTTGSTFSVVVEEGSLLMFIPAVAIRL